MAESNEIKKSVQHMKHVPIGSTSSTCLDLINFEEVEERLMIIFYYSSTFLSSNLTLKRSKSLFQKQWESEKMKAVVGGSKSLERASGTGTGILMS